MKNYIFLCLMKKGAGPAIVESIATSISERKDVSAYFIVPSEIENRERLERIGNNVQIIHIGTGNRKTFIIKSIEFLALNRKKISRKTDGTKFDLYLQIFPHPWGKLIGKLFEYTKSAVICHDPISHTGEKNINRLISEHIYRQAENLVVHTKSFADLANKKYERPVYYMPHGLYSNYKLNCNIADTSELENATIRFLFFGRIEKYKGIENLLRAFLKFNVNDKVKLVIAGKGNLEPYAELLNDYRIVVINRYLDDQEISNLFSDRNSVLVLPYIDATQSGIALIAIGLEVPIIATDTGGLREQLNSGKFGFFCKPGDIDSLFQKMNLLYNDKTLMDIERKKMHEFKPYIQWDCLLDDLARDITNGGTIF